MSDWTSSERRIKTANGYIYYGGPCRDNYHNLERYDQGGGHTIFELQRPAMKAFKAAQVRLAKRNGWSKKRIENNPDGMEIVVLAGTNRSCATQTALYRSDSSRYAPPQYTGHTRGLAVDLDQRQDHLADIHSCLLAEGWHYARSDEPWHTSYWVSI